MTLTQITEKGIKDGEIVNADINASAAIAGSKIDPSFTSNLTITNTQPKIFLTDSNNTSDFSIQNENGNLNFYDETNTASRIRIIADGKIGINTTSPTEQLTLGDGDLKFFHSNAANAHRTTFIEFGNSSNRITSEMNYGSDNSSNYTAGLKFTTKNFNGSSFVTVDALNIQANGNVGIGTTSPSNKLVVNSAAHDDGLYVLAANNNQSTRIKLQGKSSGGTEHNWILDAARGADRFGISNGTSTHLAILDGGNVGIGTTTPGGKLSVFDSSSAVFRLETPGVIAIAHSFDGTDYTIANNDGSNGHPIIFGSKTAGVESMRLDSSGRLLIGKTTPSNPLGTNAELYLEDNTAYDATSNRVNGLVITNDSDVDGGFAGIELRASDGDGYVGTVLLKAVADGTNYSNDFVIQTRHGGNWGERLRIDSAGDLTINSGNLIIGTSGKGIDFSAAPNATGMSSEVLDRYEEGTWTPTWVGSSGTGTFSYDTQYGKYTRIGQHVFYTWVLIANGHSGSTNGAIRVAGLPYAVDSNMSPNAGTVFPIIGWNDSFDNCLVTQLNSSEEIEFYKQVQSSGANYSSVMASSMNLGSLYAKGGGHYIS